MRLAALEVLEEHVEALGLLTVVLDHDARAADHLTGVALAVDLAKTGPGAKGLRVRHLEQVDLVLVAQSLDELEVLGLVARLDENAKVGLAAVERLGALAQTTGKTVVDKGLLQDLLESVLDGHGALGGGSVGDLDLLDLLGNFLDVRHGYGWMEKQRVASSKGIAKDVLMRRFLLSTSGEEWEYEVW